MLTLIDLHQVDTFGLYILQINADTETRSGPLLYCGIGTWD